MKFRCKISEKTLIIFGLTLIIYSVFLCTYFYVKDTHKNQQSLNLQETTKKIEKNKIKILKKAPIKNKNISRYDDLIKKYSKQLSWDWRLFAALICQESKFDANAKNHQGASGLMQLMPQTFKKMGGTKPFDPEQNIKYGVKYLKYLKKYFYKSKINKIEQIKFTIASYNVGYANVIHAQKLAIKYNLNPNQWTNSVETCMKMKSKPMYYKSDVVNYGYCNGELTAKYVVEIFERYQYYKENYN